MRHSVALLLMLFVAEPAHAYVCSRVQDSNNQESGPSLAWFKRDLTFAMFVGGTKELPVDQTWSTICASFQAWVGVSECVAPNRHTDIAFTGDATPVTKDLVGYDFLNPSDNHNLIIFRDVSWPHPGQAGAGIIALTTTTYSAQTGEILDADIEFNSSEFTFTVGDTDVQTDLMNTAVHEIGHVLGLGHPDAWAAIDPTCQTQATMCSTAQHGETSKRTLHCDDRNAVVYRYPAGAPITYCTPPSCVGALEGCGNCSSEQCTPWAACGFCAPKTPLTATAAVTVTGFDTGTGGCDCGAAQGGHGVALLIGLALAARRRCSR